MPSIEISQPDIWVQSYQQPPWANMSTCGIYSSLRNSRITTWTRGSSAPRNLKIRSSNTKDNFYPIDKYTLYSNTFFCCLMINGKEWKWILQISKYIEIIRDIQGEFLTYAYILTVDSWGQKNDFFPLSFISIPV